MAKATDKFGNADFFAASQHAPKVTSVDASWHAYAKDYLCVVRDRIEEGGGRLIPRPPAQARLSGREFGRKSRADAHANLIF
jgi:hypothetical protein